MHFLFYLFIFVLCRHVKNYPDMLLKDFCKIHPQFFIFFCSVCAGRGFVWKTTAGLASTWTNVQRTFPAVTSASTPTDLSTACVPMDTSVPLVTRTAAGLSQVPLLHSAAQVWISSHGPSQRFYCQTWAETNHMAGTHILSLVATYI